MASEAVLSGGFWLLYTTNLLTVSLALLTVLHLCGHLYAAQTRDDTRHIPRGISRSRPARCSAGQPRAARSSGPVSPSFAILFVWQFPHFMAIAWLYRHDYGRAGIRMLPVVQPDGFSTVIEALFYAVLMIPVSLAPWWLGMAGVTYAILATILGLLYLGYTIRFSRILRATSETQSRMFARDLLKVSVIYLPLLLTCLMLAATVK